jgi:hypothetical protein
MIDRVRTKKTHPALKHGVYSAAAILPGENRAEFERLYQDLIAELCPDGPLEDDAVAQLARLVWRKQNLAIYRMAKIARGPYKPNASELSGSFSWRSPDREEVLVAECAAAVQADEHRARKELGESYELVAIGEMATAARLFDELHLEERLDSLIDRCLKRLLHVRGIKSMRTACASTAPQRLPDPTKAA